MRVLRRWPGAATTRALRPILIADSFKCSATLFSKFLNLPLMKFSTPRKKRRRLSSTPILMPRRTGVGFTRNPATGVKEFYGEFLMNGQGEDVVAGIRTPVHISELRKIMPQVYDQLREITTRLEKHYRDMQDFEFTIQEGKLYMLQTRNGKRTGLAAVQVALQLVEEGWIR